MTESARPAKKVAYFEKLTRLCESYSTVLIVHADHVGSRQMAGIRFALRGKAVILMGKNTMIRTALRKLLPTMPQLDRLIPYVKQNIGLIFCVVGAAEVRKIIMEHKVPAAAKQGVIAPCDVVIPAGPTGADISQTSFFQAVGIATKINKLLLEIATDVHLIKTGDKVTASQSALLQKLNIRPFEYGLGIRSIYDDGSVYDASVLDITNDDIIAKFKAGVQNVAALSRQLCLPNQTSVPHSIMEAFKHCVAAVLETDFTFPEMMKIKEMVENPDAFVSEAAPAAVAAAPEKVEEKVVEEDEESEEDFGMGLFD